MTKVLYVEHNDDNLYMLKTRLELLGDFEVLAADDSEKGCKLAVTEHPDVILMDLEMPVLDRWEALRRSSKIRKPATSRSSACPRMRWTANASRPLPRGATNSMPNRSNSSAWSQPFGACLRTPNRCSDRGDHDGAPPGRRTVNTEPLPGSLATVTSPPIMRASLRAMARPRPVPPKRCAVVAIRLAELLEQLRLLLRGHADAGVGDGQLDPVAAVPDPARLQLDLALFGELAGIAQEIEQNLPQPHGVHGQGTKVLLCFDHQPVLILLGELTCGPDDLVDQGRELHGLWVEFKLTGLDLRQVEHLVDEAEKVSSSAIHPLQWLLAPSLCRSVPHWSPSFR